MSVIDKDEAVRRIAGIARLARSDKQKALLGRCMYIIEHCPTVDAEPVRHGRWIYGITLNHEWRKCSECLVSQDIFGCFTYCPNCGAKMYGGAE